jgi:ketosteroid isomerase-like protein
MTKLLVGLCAAAMAIAGAAYGATERSGNLSIDKQAALYQIGKIEKTWHRAASKKDIDLFMSLWASNATATLGGTTYTGKQAIRAIFAKAAPFQPQNHWISDTAAYRIRASVNGDKGTLSFECHFIDVDTGTVTSVTGNDSEVRKIKGTWLITDLRASSATLGG